jgi:hypothetical protein
LFEEEEEGAGPGMICSVLEAICLGLSGPKIFDFIVLNDSFKEGGLYAGGSLYDVAVS